MITDDFAEVWPDVARPLSAMLRRRGVNPHDADEIVQETAARAFGKQVPFTDADDLFRWASVVSWRLAVDTHRRRSRLSDTVVPDRADSVDVAALAEHRVVLGAVRDRLAELSQRDREVLLSSFDDGPVRTRLESVRLAVARHRARNRLRAMLEGLAAPILGLWARRHRMLSAPAEAIAYSVTPAAACALISLAVLAGPSPQRVDVRPSAAPPAVASVAPPPVTVAPAAVTAPDQGSVPAPHESPGPKISASEVVIPTGNGDAAVAGVRDKQPSDALACLDPPSALGQKTVCVQQPVELGLSSR